MNRWFDIGQTKKCRVDSTALFWAGYPNGKRPAVPSLHSSISLTLMQQYMLPQGARHRFVDYPVTTDESRVVYELWPFLDKMRLPRPYIDLARDSYDDCLGYLDEQLGLLFDALQRRGVLDQTLVVVTSDHGEGLGEHNLFDHG